MQKPEKLKYMQYNKHFVGFQMQVLWLKKKLTWKTLT